MAMFTDRTEAGFLLAEQLAQKDVSPAKSVVCGITRGGVVIASVIARIVGLPLRPLVVKKIGAPGHSELAVGAIAPKDTIYWDVGLVRELGLEKSDLAHLSKEATVEFKKREQLLKPFGSLGIVKNRTALLVDDGIATGATVKAALLCLTQYKARRVVLVTPVIAEPVYNELLKAFSEIITLSIAEEFHAVGEFYDSFLPVSDDDVLTILEERKQ